MTTIKLSVCRVVPCSARFATLTLKLAILGALPASAQPFFFNRTFDDPTPTLGGLFGDPVALHGNNVLIGVQWDGTAGPNVGQAHLFDAATGDLLQTFDDPTPVAGDRFGFSVAIDGNNVLIGAIGDNTGGLDVGQAYLFDAATGNLLQTFNDPTPTGQDFFGGSVAIDGTNVLIAAGGDDTRGTDIGQAHLFDAATGNLLRTFDDPNPTTRDGFGRRVAIDGANVLIGADGDDTGGTDVGQAHLFDAATGDLLQTFDDPTPTTRDGFGYSVAIDGTYVLIGTFGDDTGGTDVGQAHLFDAATGNLLQTFNDPTPTSGDRFGASLAIDGTNVLIGAWGDDADGADIGQAHLFDAVTGNLLQTFNHPFPEVVDFFGSSVAIHGTNILIGAPFNDTGGTNVGQAHLFTIPEPATWALAIAALVAITFLSARRSTAAANPPRGVPEWPRNLARCASRPSGRVPRR